MANDVSQLLTDLNSTPPVKHQSIDIESRLRRQTGVVAFTTGTSGDIKTFVRVPSRARIEELYLATDQLDSNVAPTLAGEIGVYNTPANGGAAVSAALFAASGTAFGHTASKPYVDVLSNVAAGNRGQALWQLLGLSSDPGIDYDIAITLTANAATFAAGNAALRVGYLLAE